MPDWFLDRNDYKDNRFSQIISNALGMKLRDNLNKLKKISPLLDFISSLPDGESK